MIRYNTVREAALPISILGPFRSTITRGAARAVLQAKYSLKIAKQPPHSYALWRFPSCRNLPNDFINFLFFFASGSFQRRYNSLLSKDLLLSRLFTISQLFSSNFIFERGSCSVWKSLDKSHFTTLQAKRVKFSIDTFFGTPLEIKNNEVTGNLDGVPTFAEGKLSTMQKWSEENNFQLNEAIFYTDSINDLPLVKACKHSIIISPDKELEKYAKENSLEIIYRW